MAKQRGPRKLEIRYKTGRLTVIGFDEDYVKPSGLRYYKHSVNVVHFVDEYGNLISGMPVDENNNEGE